MVSICASTFRAPRHIKEAFWSDEQGSLAAVPDCDKLLLSTFDARVDCHKCANDVWNSVFGGHGLDVRNQAI